MRLCEIEGCNNKYHGSGLCQHHKNKLDRHGDPLWKKPGLTKYPEYSVWNNMKARCSNINNPEYKNYGGRGISVYDLWKKSFLIFYKDIGPKPFYNSEIDRINNNGNYEPDNCRWTSHIENQRNKRTTIVNMIIAMEIRKIRKETKLTYPKIAQMYNIKSNVVTDICLNRSWVEVV